MAHELIQPTHPSEALQGYGIVLLNHGGSTVSQDTGRDARDLTTRFGIPTFAIDRPGTARWWPDRELAHFLSTPKGYKAEMAELGDTVNAELAEAGVERALIMGRSAGGLGALALTAANVVTSQVAVYAAEPVGCKQQTVANGRRWYGLYRDIERKIQNTEPDVVRPRPPGLGPLASLGRLASMARDNATDRFHSGKVWASDAATSYMQTIAEAQPAIDMTVDFAGFSMMVDNKGYDQLNSGLADIRPGIHLERVPHTTHASFDNREFIAKRVDLVFNRLLEAS